MDNEELNIEEINRNLQESFIHYDPNRVDYSVSNMEFELLEKTGNNIWKDFFIACLAIAIPCLINGYVAFSEIATNESLSSEVFVNFLIGSVCFILACICLGVWQNNKKGFKKLIKQIKGKPKYKLPQQNR